MYSAVVPPVGVMVIGFKVRVLRVRVRVRIGCGKG
jgi:hypothetical protein